jgi:hypothetical protein
MASFKLHAVDQKELEQLIAQQAPRGVRSKGGELVEEFLDSGNVAATVQFASTKERNAVAISATNFARTKGHQLWVRKVGGGTGNALLLVNLTKADAATRKAYETRPRPGRRPAKR